jgi:hypothetical protein
LSVDGGNVFEGQPEWLIVQDSEACFRSAR